jgi:HlyD family secretion protein
MLNKKNNLIKYLIIAVVVLVAFAIIGKKMGWIGGVANQKVAVEKVSLRTIVETVSASGKIQPEIEVKISSDVSGEIVSLMVKEGQKVKRGQLLCKIRPDIYESYLDRASAALNTSKANLSNAEARFIQTEQAYDRNSKLIKDKIISEADFEVIKSNYLSAKADVQAAKFNVKSAEASVKEAKDNLFKTTVFSPVDGTVSKLNVELGERVLGTSQMTGTEIMRIANLNSMEVSVDVNENDINRLSIGDTAIVEVDAFLDQSFKGVVTEIANSASVVGASADQVTNFPVKIRILSESYSKLNSKDKNLASPLRPGLSATVEIQTEKTVNILTVPIQSVTTREDSVDDKNIATTVVAVGASSMKEFVFVIENNKVIKLPVKTGIQDDMYIEIKEGLKEGQEVVVAPYLAISKMLKDGMQIEIVSKEDLYTSDEKK